MRIDILLLGVAYVLSQFYRTFLAVLTGPLERDLGATAEDLALASGVWFLTFAAMQIPVGWALDRIGPRRSSAALLLLGGGGGAALFAVATEPWHVAAAMGLIGMGCSNVLMAAYFIFARVYSPAVFATLAAVFLGTGTLGNLLGALPLALAVEAFGWRGCMAAVALATLAVGAAMWRMIKDPPMAEGGGGGSILDLLKSPAVWLLVPMMMANYAPSAGMRGLWIGPYFRDVFGADPARVGQVALLMGIAMIAGTYTYGPLDRLLGTRKWVIVGGNSLALVALLALAMSSGVDWRVTAALFAAVGFFASSYPLVMAHARAFFPPALTGRGVTFVNLMTIGSVGLIQLITGRLHAAAAPAAATDPAAAYTTIFGFYAAALTIGILVYLRAPDRRD